MPSRKANKSVRQLTPMLIIGSQPFYQRVFFDYLSDSFELFYFNHRGFIAKPDLFLQGKFDFVAGPASLWDDYLGQLENHVTELFLRSGHYPMVEEPRRFRLILLDWLLHVRQN